MAILTETKLQLDKQFGAGKPANIPLGGEDLFRVREACSYPLGRYQMTVGFYDGVARYVSFAKDRLDDPHFSERDAEVCLALIAPPPLEWAALENPAVTAISEHRITLQDSRGREIEILACYRRTRPYFFAYIPAGEEAQPAQIDALMQKMNAAASLEEKVDAMAAVIRELVAQKGG
ncbi:MAG TPA: hypothetical protein VHY22_19155 [Chthoniobacteraceae bacterium]|nr:hypothetical protein [Chthoniobacteraceae bacterium]